MYNKKCLVYFCDWEKLVIFTLKNNVEHTNEAGIFVVFGKILFMNLYQKWM